MTNKNILICVLGILLIGNLNAQNNNLLGTWVKNNGEIQRSFDNVFYETFTSNGVIGIRGTYNIRGNSLILTPTHLHGNIFNFEPRWYSQAELRGIIRQPDTWEIVEFFFRSSTQTYILRGNTLTLTAGNDPSTVWTRK